MILSPAQNKIAEDIHRYRVLACGRKFGKTTLACEEIIGKAVFGDNRRVMYLAPTLGDARRLMWDRLKQKLGRAVVKENDTRLELKVRTVKGGTSDIFLGSWELVNNYRGDEFDLIVPDETQDYRNFWVGWQEALRPTLTPRQGSALFMGTPKGFTHFYDLHNLELSNPDFKSFKFSTYDNPFIPVEEIETARKELPPDRFAQEYLAEFRKSEGLVFKEFNRERHIFSEQVYGYSEKLGGVDFGFTNPCAILTIGIKDGVYYVLSELYKTGMTDIQTAEYTAAKGFNQVYPDPESPAAIAEMKKLGINVREVIKGKDSIQNGINKIRELFLSNRLFIHKSCINLISELESYAYPDKMTNRNDNENPIDEFNHAIDALRYVISMHSPKKLVRPQPFHDQMIDIWRNQ